LKAHFSNLDLAVFGVLSFGLGAAAPSHVEGVIKNRMIADCLEQSNSDAMYLRHTRANEERCECKKYYQPNDV